MTERISHEEALREIDRVDGHWNAVGTLRDYVRQQQALEADTVSRALDVESIAARVHDNWMASKHAAGVESRKLESGEELMVPYAQLSEQAKDLDRVTVRAVLAALPDTVSRAEYEAALAETAQLKRALENASPDGEPYNGWFWTESEDNALPCYGYRGGVTLGPIQVDADGELTRFRFDEDSLHGETEVVGYVSQTEKADEEIEKLEAKLTALQAEHERVAAAFSEKNTELFNSCQGLLTELATERARAEETDRRLVKMTESAEVSAAIVQQTQGVHISWVHECNKLRDQLAAANARAGRLEELARELGGEHEKLMDIAKLAWAIRTDTDRETPGKLDDALECFDDLYRSHLARIVKPYPYGEPPLSTAPQASTATLAPGEWLRENEDGELVVLREPQNEELDAAMRSATAPQASTEQASPSPAVGEAYECNCPAPYPEAVHDLTCPEHLKRFPEDKPAQPAPDGTERYCSSCQGPCLQRGTVGHHLTPVEPQGRPEQAGDRVDQLLNEYRAAAAELHTLIPEGPVKALADRGHAVSVDLFRELADRLEGK